jgi:hypothetical protein
VVLDMPCRRIKPGRHYERGSAVRGDSKSSVKNG